MMFYKEYYCTNTLLVSKIKDNDLNNIKSKIKDKIDTMNLVENATNKIIYANDNFYDEDLFLWFNECIDDLCDEQYIPDIRLVITECWVTHTQKFQKHHLHSHPNSIVSGIFYLDNVRGTTDFYLPNVWAKVDEVFSIAKTYNTKTSIEPESGKLILFVYFTQEILYPLILFLKDL